MEAMIKKFTAAHPDIKVNASFAPSGPPYGQALITQIQSGNAPDVFYGNGGSGATESLIPLAKSGKLLDLSQQPFAKEIPAQAKDLYTVGGKVYGMLMDESPHGILYNATLMKRLGVEVPKTFDEVLDVCAKARAQGLYGIALFGQAAALPAEVIAASLVYSQDPEWNEKRRAGQVTFADTPGWRETLQWFLQMSKAKCFQPGAESATVPQAFEAITSGKAVMAIVPSGALGAVMAIKKYDWAMAPFPGSTPESTRVAVGYNDALAVSAASKNKDAALALLDYWAGEGAATWARLSGTVTLAAGKTGELSGPLQDFASAYKSGQVVSRPHEGWEGGSAYNALNTAVVAAMTGQKSVPDALKSVDQAWGK